MYTVTIDGVVACTTDSAQVAQDCARDLMDTRKDAMHIIIAKGRDAGVHLFRSLDSIWYSSPYTFTVS